MYKTFSHLQSRLTLAHLAALTVAGLLFHLWASEVLNAAYAASGFPVPYWQAQLSFDHVQLKGWYGELLRGGTFGLYVHTQIVDFLFIASVLVLHSAALLLVSRGLPAQSKGRRFLVWAALLSTIAPLADAVENGISFLMLARPTDFEPALALAYSSFAALKFGVFTLSYVVALGGVLATIVVWALRQRRGGVKEADTAA